MKPLLPIVVGSFNNAKAAEMVELLKDLRVPVLLLSAFPGAQQVPEEGVTFAENARAKALGMARQIPPQQIFGVVADDSGLEVDALGGRPGVWSARYVSETATDPERVRRILEELKGLPEDRRTARFRCHIALANNKEILLETEGVVEGRIAFAPAGDFGFGYDPIFIPRNYGKTFGELGGDIKHKISHRAMALRRFHEALPCLLLHPVAGEE